MQKPSLLSCFFFVFFIPQLSFSCPQDQRQSLLEFKNLLTHNIKNGSITDQALRDLETWKPNSDCCKWQLVRYDALSPSREVTDLNLTYLVRSDSGSVSSSILRPVLRISSLVTLYVSRNSIEGKIPGDAFVNLTRLISLDMRLNNFNGSIPTELCSLKTLQRLDLSRNAIGGTLNGDIKELKNLQELVLVGNLIGGAIPPEIGSLVELRVLSMSWNKFNGSIPLSVSQLTKLETFDLQSNSLSFEIPNGIGNLVNLSTLSFSMNKLSGGIPSSIQNLKYLQSLTLNGNKDLSGEIPTWLFGLQNLRILRFGGNKLQWNSNGSVFAQSKLYELSLRACGLEGNIPDWLKNLTALVYLDLSMKKLQGSFPKWLADLKIARIIIRQQTIGLIAS
ncbi:Receptor-like protein 46 [Cardamine amara subsp. amara]|uniref:Receptor-like protein 46 n=1 Tax=Cardamine amara subsp. amara TaxID=228776 RepID=A0ABD0ZYR8_CARAN